MQIFPGHRRIVVGVDGSPNSLAALRRAAAEAEARHARLDVYHVLPGHRPTAFLNAGEWLRLRSLVAGELPAGQHPMTRLHIAQGEVTEALLKAARRAEVLVIGARRHSENGNPLGGSTVPAIMSGAPCEVIVCANHATATAQDV